MKSIRLSIPLKIAIFLAFAFSIVTFISSQIKLNELHEQEKEWQMKIEQAEEEIAQIQNKLDTPFDKNYITELAKEKLNYCLPDEILFYNDLID